MTETKKEILGNKHYTRERLVEAILELNDSIEMKDKKFSERERGYNIKWFQLKNRVEYLDSEIKQKDREILRLKSIIVELSAKLAFGDIK